MWHNGGERYPHGAWRSSVARLLWEQEVPGSNPGAPTRRHKAFLPCAVFLLWVLVYK